MDRHRRSAQALVNDVIEDKIHFSLIGGEEEMFCVFNKKPYL